MPTLENHVPTSSLFSLLMCPSFLHECRLFLEAARPENYTTCMENKHSLVVSEVFCLPHDYRKDVPPPSELSFYAKFYINLNMYLMNALWP